MFNLTKQILIFVLLFGATACNKQIGSTSSLSTGGGTSGGTGPGSTTSPAFEVIVSSQYESGGTVTVESDCNVPLTSPYGTISACNVVIPEERLHYSRLSFTFNFNTPHCENAAFFPYYYRASNAALFVSTWNTTGAICNVSPVPADCYSGVGVDIIQSAGSDFPQYKGLYYLPGAQNVVTHTFTGKSANEKLRASNRWAVNNSTGAAVATNNGAAYVVGQFYGDGFVGAGVGNYGNYQFRCYDKWYETVLGLNIFITDQDQDPGNGVNTPGNPNLNQFPDWDLTGWGL